MLLVPTKSTLNRYGLSESEWQQMADNQNGRCFVCEKEPKKGRLCIDHDHAKNWKKMPPEQRKLYVRGLLCWFCNHHFLCRGISVQKSKRVTLYIENYEARKPK